MADARVVECRASPDYQLHLRFSDGLAGTVFLGNLLEIAWRDIDVFLKVRIDSPAHAVTWPTGRVRLDTDILYCDMARRLNPIAKDAGFQRFMKRALDWEGYLKTYAKFNGSDAAQMQRAVRPAKRKPRRST